MNSKIQKHATSLPSRSLSDYLQWSRSIWELPLSSAASPNDDLLVMGFGLAGETGEVLELLEMGEPEPSHRTDLAKELGDVFYYWSCLCWRMGVDPRSSWESALSPGNRLPEDMDAAGSMLAAQAPTGSIDRLGVMLSARNGAVLEQLKKSVRDGHLDIDRFNLAMGQQAQVWCALVHALDFKPSGVLSITVAKVEGRIARGTLMGSGNHR